MRSRRSRATPPAMSRTSPNVAVTVANGRVNVLWSHLVNAAALERSSQKTGGCNECADAGAITAQTIPADGLLRVPCHRDELAPARRPRQERGGDGREPIHVRLPAQARGYRRGARDGCVSSPDHIRFRRRLPDHDRRRGTSSTRRTALSSTEVSWGCRGHCARARLPVLDTLHHHGRRGLHSLVDRHQENS
jgi:hypothetical protein